MTDSLFSHVDDSIKEEVDKAFSPLRNNGPLGIYIDGANLLHTTKLLEFRTDFVKLRELISLYAPIRTLNFFASETESREALTLNRLLAKSGYNVHVKNVVQKPVYEGKKVSVARKKNVDVDMAVYAVDNASTDQHLSQFILFTGDGDFLPAVKVLKRRGPVTVISSNETTPSLLCRQLRESCDHFIDLKGLKEVIAYHPAKFKKEESCQVSSLPPIL